MNKIDEIIEYLKQWRANPLHWTNNKRRINGLKPLRGKSNKNKFNPPLELVLLIEAAIEEENQKYIKKIIDNLPNIEDIKCGKI